MRFAIKHAVRNNEPRNLYNLAFHYSALLKGYVDYEKTDLLKQSYFISNFIVMRYINKQQIIHLLFYC